MNLGEIIKEPIKVKKVFQKLEDIRNDCAHSSFKQELEEKYPPKELGELIELTKDLNKKLVAAIENNRPKESKKRGNELLKRFMKICLQQTVVR